MGTGCKVLLIVGAILAAVVIVGVILSYVYCEKFMTSMMDKSVTMIEQQVAKDLPDEYGLDDVKAVFKDFKDYIKSGNIKDKMAMPEMQNFARQIQDVVKDKKIDKEELDKLLETMKKVMGK